MFFKFHVLNNALFLSHKNYGYQPDGALEIWTSTKCLRRADKERRDRSSVELERSVMVEVGRRKYTTLCYVIVRLVLVLSLCCVQGVRWYRLSGPSEARAACRDFCSFTDYLSYTATVHDIRDICTHDVIHHDVSCVGTLANSPQLPRDLDKLASFLVFKEYFCNVSMVSGYTLQINQVLYYTHPHGQSYVYEYFTINSSSSLGAILNSWALMMMAK